MSQKFQIRCLIVTVCFALLAGTAAASREISVEGEYWNPQISGSTTATTKLDFKNDLGLRKADILHLTLSYKRDKGSRYFIKNETPSFKESVNLTRSLIFNSGNYAAGARITTNLDVKHFQFGIQNDKFISSGKFSTIYSYNHNSVNTTVQNTTQNFNRNKNDTSDCLSLGFAWESLHKKGVNYFAEVTPLSIGARGSYLDYNVGIKTNLSKILTPTLGYRGENIRAGQTASSDGTKVHLKGLYIFIGTL